MLRNPGGFRSMSGLIGVLALATSCSAAFGQDHETWRCDAPNGHYDANEPPIWDKTTSISGRISFHKAYPGPAFGSIAKIGFTDSKLQDGDCHCNGLFVKSFHDPDRVGFYMLVDGETVLFEQGRTMDTPITFKISIDAAGLMTVQVGKEHMETKTATLPHPQRDTMEMS